MYPVSRGFLLGYTYLRIIDHLLSAQERDRRCAGRYRPPFHVIGGLSTSLLMNTNVPSLFWTTYQGLFGDIVEHLRVDEAIIDYNYTRLIKCAEIWAQERKDRFKSYPADVALDQKDYALALEFFLQIDGKSVDEVRVIKISV